MVRSGGHEARGNAAGAIALAGVVPWYNTTWQLVASRVLEPDGADSMVGAELLQLGPR